MVDTFMRAIGLGRNRQGEVEASQALIALEVIRPISTIR